MIDRAAYDRQYRKEHAKKKAAYMREYWQKHVVETAIRRRKYNLEHADEIATRDRKYRQAHIREKTAYAREYAQAHPEKIRAKGLKRTARKKNAPGYNYTTAEMIRNRWQMFGNCCYICGGRAEATDHVKPLARGGAHFPCNLRPICSRCNSKKNDKWPYSPLSVAGP